MNMDHDSQDDPRLAALFRSVPAETCPADEDFLARLRRESSEAFTAAASEAARPIRRRHPMLVIALRGLASLAAAVAVAASLWLASNSGDSALTFGQALQNAAAADTLRLEITRDGKPADVWSRRAEQQLRVNRPDGTYTIVHGDRLWQIDEPANRATSRAASYFPADGKSGPDLLSLLDVPVAGREENLLSKRPSQRIQHEGVECDLYQAELAAAEGTIRVEAWVEAGTQRLRSIETKSSRSKRIEPIAQLKVVATNEPVDENLFVVGDTLTEDGRIGRVTDLQGIVSVQPATHRRWTPVDSKIPIKPGDWLRTDLRGANAASVRLVKQTDVTLGPGTLVEWIMPGRIRLVSGEVKIAAEAASPLELLGPGDEKVLVKETSIYRLDQPTQQKLVRVEKTPLWLAGFESATANQSIGSLVVNVDGRDVPLTVGYHKVTVDVRDQIARTVVEESFVNHTDGRLEGVFYFPLPQDASISGFGMWIGNELIEADVVEKQRAREIYETILRERRDPGLLEWTGGNLFKARVFPIEAHSEKRIKITYTQVLPLKGNRYRYSYSLQSEMLRLNPLRELAIDVNINSAIPLAGVSSPTHTTRIQQTQHSARVEFSAQEYTPTRDFEVVVEVDQRQPAVVMVPHRRGDDGYFLLQLGLPAAADDWQRDVLPDGEPLELLVLADTSASIDADGRRRQAELVAAMFSALTPEDRINLAGCDVNCDWVFEKAAAATAENRQAAEQFLAGRTSLGWTDLDKAIGSALKQCGPKTCVVYLGDGIGTTGDADPAALAKRLRRLHEESGRKGTFHAVSVGSSFESIVLRTLASFGGGSVRQITGETGPASIALQLLGEITRPGMRDLKVEFEGIRTARVYPQELPNLAGTQQILLGRYLPEGRDQSGRVIVTGMQNGQPVRLTADVSLKDAEQGNSFIPRLWARMHLDALLDQGTSPAIKDEIIALSEEYNIITPYTSLLVLETDADRERFGVERRFRMRDGEKFFAQGRDNADYELLQQQIRRAGDWRIALRRMVLGELGALGRDAQVFQPIQNEYLGYGMGGGMGGMGGGSFGGSLAIDGLSISGSISSLRSRGLGPMGGSINGPVSFEGGELFDFDRDDAFANRGEMTAKEELFAGDDLGLTDEKTLNEKSALDGDDWAEPGDRLMKLSDLRASSPMSAPQPKRELSLGLEYRAKAASRAFFSADKAGPGGRRGTSALSRRAGAYYYDMNGPGYDATQYTQWLDTLFPGLAAIPTEPTDEEPQEPWPAEAKKLAESLLRNEQLAALDGGLKIERRTESFEPRLKNLNSRSEMLALVSPGAWLIRSGGDASQTLVAWCNGQQRGVFSEAFQLGRVRTSAKQDLARLPLDLSGYVTDSVEAAYRQYTAEVRPQDAGQTLLVLKTPGNRDHEVHVRIDTARAVILSIETRQNDKVTSRQAFGQFVEAAGAWWATEIENTDNEGRRWSLTTQSFQPLTADALQQQVRERLAGLARVQLLQEPIRTVLAAKGALADGKADLDDQMTLLLHFAASQQWTRVMEHLEQAEKLAADKPGMRWVRDAVLGVGRRHEELKVRLLDEARQLTVTQPGGATNAEEFFLASYLLGQAGGILEANEMLGLLDGLRPLFERQPAHLQAMKQWTQQRAEQLGRAQQVAQALALWKQLAEEYPHDYGMQQRYANELVNASQDYEAAYAWLRKVLVDEARWLPYEDEVLRGTYATLLRQEGNYAELADLLAQWVQRNPPSPSTYQQYLSALVKADRAAQADTVAAAWLQEGRVAEPLKPEVASRLHAAVSHMLGQGFDLYTDRIDPKWLDPLAEAASFFARHESQLATANQIMTHHRFQQSDACRRVRKQIAGVLTAEIDTLRPEQIQNFVQWIWPNDPAVELPVWKKIAAGIERRWAAEKKDDVKHQLAQPLVQILSGKAEPADYLVFLRRQLEQGPKQYRAAYAGNLFNVLIAQPWSAEREDEAFALLEQLSAHKDSAERLAVWVEALYRLTDRMVAARFDARMAAIEHQETLTRIELHEKKTEAMRLAREQFVDRLKRAEPKHAAPLGRWMLVERLYLETLLARDLRQVAEACWEELGPEPPAAEKSLDEQGEIPLEKALEAIRRDRLLTTLLNLAARKKAEPAAVDRLLGYLDRAIAADPSGPQWKLWKYQLLVALDRPEALEKDLRAWVQGDEADHRWRLSLGYLLAERSKLSEAIQQFEAVGTADELGPTEYRVLADWYLVVDRRPQRETALISAFKTAEEWQLSNWLSQKLQPWQRSDGQLPAELDQDVLRVFAALFAKSGNPQQFLGQLREFYTATRDFRLLSGLADAVVGQTAGRVYPFLQNMRSVLDEVRDEATADSIVEHLATVRPRAATAVDRRALDLLELLVERRAAELLNQPGPHVEKALAAMQRAFKGEWSAGEPRLMADFLAALGKLPQQPLADEQVRELQVLHGQAAPGTIDRLHIGHRWANALWSYGKAVEAIDLLRAELDAYQKACGGVLPAEANGPLDSLISYLEQQTHHAEGEQLLLAQLGHPLNRQQGFWLTQRLYQLYEDAIRHQGDVSLGSGPALYATLHHRIQDELDTPDQNHRAALLSRLCTVYRTAHDVKLDGVAADLRTFAFERLPKVLPRQTNNYQSIVGQVAETLCVVSSPRDGLTLFIERLENEPSWLRYSYQDGWNQFGWRIAQLRSEVKDLGDLEPRLLKLVCGELRKDLESQQQRNRAMYHANYGYFWREKIDDFAHTAEEVYDRQKGSGAAVLYIADYLFHGLDRRDRAIEMLLVAHRGEILDEAGQSRLVDFLHQCGRYGESIGILEPLIETRPENMRYRTWLMHAYFRTNRPDQLLALLKQTDAFFHQQNRWQEAALAPLAYSCLENQLYRQSVDYYNELIPLHQRTQPRRGIGNGTLSSYYSSLALAHAGLKDTAGAVDAACGAIVSWGPRDDNRRDAISSLQQVLRGATDLDGYVAQLDREAAKTGLHNPIVRKAVGQVYLEKEQFAKAIAQLQLACELQPGDAEIHRALIACYDRQEDKPGAIRQVLASLALSRREITLCDDLGQRYDAEQQSAEAERAYTSIVELLPNESESHTLLAEIRQRQDRWDEAILHWQQVARIRALEPTGLLKLVEAQIHQKQWDAATATLRRLDTQGWPSRFGDVPSQVRQLQQNIPPQGK